MKRVILLILVFVKGLCMGATEVVQGVSGSTMALILGVYHDLIGSLRAIDRDAIKLLRAGKIRSLWKKINGDFVSALFAGIIASIILFTQVVSYFLEKHFISTTSLFFGFIVISALLVLQNIKKWNIVAAIAFFIGVACNFYLSSVQPLNTPDNLLFVFLAGNLAGFMITIPGVSSAFILLLFGKYQLIVISFSRLNTGVIAIFFTGCLLGLWLASRIIHRLLTNYYSTTVALLAGLMVGALNKLWPWRNVFEYAVNGLGNQVPAHDKSIMPWDYTAITGKDPQVFQAILMMAVGVLMVVLIVKITAGLKTKI